MATADHSGINGQPPGTETKGVQPQPRGRHVSRVKEFVGGVILVIMVGVLLTAGAFTARPGSHPAEGLMFTIPAGARASVARPGFDSAIPIPTDIQFASPAAAIISVQNLDDVEHRAGPFLVGAGQTFVQRFPEPGRYPLVCTVDPLETVVVTVEG